MSLLAAQIEAEQKRAEHLASQARLANLKVALVQAHEKAEKQSLNPAHKKMQRTMSIWELTDLPRN